MITNQGVMSSAAALLLCACCCACATLSLALPPSPPRCHPAPPPDAFAVRSAAETNRTFDMPGNLTLTIFRYLTFPLLSTSNSSFSASANLTSNHTSPPSLSFLLYLPDSPPTSPPSPPSSVLYVHLCFRCVNHTVLPFCGNPSIHIDINSSLDLALGGGLQLPAGLFTTRLSLTYSAGAGELHILAVQYEEDDVVSVNLTLTNLTSASTSDQGGRLLVGYVTDKNAVITLTTNGSDAGTVDAASPSTPYLPVSNNSSTSHNVQNRGRLAWIVGGTVFGAAVTMGLAILFLLMKRRRVEAVSSSTERFTSSSALLASRNNTEACEVPILRNFSFAPARAALHPLPTPSLSFLPQQPTSPSISPACCPTLPSPSSATSPSPFSAATPPSLPPPPSPQGTFNHFVYRNHKHI